MIRNASLALSVLCVACGCDSPESAAWALESIGTSAQSVVVSSLAPMVTSNYLSTEALMGNRLTTDAGTLTTLINNPLNTATFAPGEELHDELEDIVTQQFM